MIGKIKENMQNQFYSNNLKRIKSIPYWRVLPSSHASSSNSTINGVVLDTANGRLYSNFQEIIQLSKNNSLLFLYDNKTKKQIGFINVKDQIIWNTKYFNKSYYKSEADEFLKNHMINGIDGWLLPDKEHINSFNSSTKHLDSHYINHLKSISSNFLLADDFANSGQLAFISYIWK